MEAKEVGDRMALRIVFALAHRSRCQGSSGEIPFQNESNVFRRHPSPGEVEEGLFGLEIPDLQQAIDLLRKSFALMDEDAFCVRQGKILGTLEIVEVG